MNPTLFARIIGAGNVSKASVALENRPYYIRKRSRPHPQYTHRREYPSGAISLLVMGMSAWGPIEKECAPESAARGKRR